MGVVKNMQKLGRVVQTELGRVTVRFERIAACRGCGACGRAFPPFTVTVKGQAKVGDVARVLLPNESRKKMLWYTYPVYGLGFLAGLFAGNLAGEGREGLILLCGAIGLLLGVLVMKLLQSRQGGAKQSKAELIALNRPEDIAQINDPGICPKAVGFAKDGL